MSHHKSRLKLEKGRFVAAFLFCNWFQHLLNASCDSKLLFCWWKQVNQLSIVLCIGWSAAMNSAFWMAFPAEHLIMFWFFWKLLKISWKNKMRNGNKAHIMQPTNVLRLLLFAGFTTLIVRYSLNTQRKRERIKVDLAREIKRNQNKTSNRNEFKQKKEAGNAPR